MTLVTVLNIVFAALVLIAIPGSSPGDLQLTQDEARRGCRRAPVAQDRGERRASPCTPHRLGSAVAS